MLQLLRGGHFQRFTAQYSHAIALVVVAEDGPAGSLGIVGQEEPAAVAPGQVDGRMAPALGGPGRRGAACLQVGVVGGGQAQVRQPLLAAFQHAVQGRQVLAVLNGVPGTPQDLLDRIIRQ